MGLDCLKYVLDKGATLDSQKPVFLYFLNDCGYVKESGEGVDRICRELEAAGLPDLMFNNNTFILKTTVMSSAYEKPAAQDHIVSDSIEKSAVRKIVSAIEYRRIREGQSRPTGRKHEYAL